MSVGYWTGWAPTDDIILLWNVVIVGPAEALFEDGTFKLTIELTDDYPNKPPVLFLRIIQGRLGARIPP